jgi:hypothetical protein
MLEERRFAQDARHVLLQVRAAVGQIIDALPGPPRRPHQLSKLLKIDNKLAWKLTKVASEGDLFHVPRHIPGDAGVDLFVTAARRHGVSDARVAAVRAALRDLKEFIERHAGDRATLEKMLLSFSDEGREDLDLAQRKAAFEANSYLWGVRARAQVFVDFFKASSTPGRLDIVAIRGFIDLCLIRPGVPWTISQVKVANDAAQALPETRREPLDPPDEQEGGPDEVPLLRSFCSQPLPALRRVESGERFVEYEMMPREVGNRGGVTCLSGEIIRSAASYYRSADNQWAGTCTLARTPCEAVIIDWFVHEGLFGPIRPELGVYSELKGGPVISPLEGRERDRLPCNDTVNYLGKGAAVVPTPHIPNYASLIEHVFRRVGWDPHEFDVYRAQLQYPVIPTLILVKHELHEAPR